MQYPSTLIEAFRTAANFAEVASVHENAPEGRKLTQEAVYMWKARNQVPHMWRPVVRALMIQKNDAGRENLTTGSRGTGQ
jgi:hypothetical protein